jgi:hypothetical protein
MNKPASSRQVGGDHYLNMKIKPLEFSMANNLNAAQHTAIKYICRTKNNRIEDIDKAIHTLELWREMVMKGRTVIVKEEKK